MTQYRYPNGQIVSVQESYYPASCDGCGWQGSSGDCGIDTGFDDSDVYCPRCCRPGADCGKAAEAAVKAPAEERAEP